MFAASLWPRMPKTPHSSWKWSSRLRSWPRTVGGRGGSSTTRRRLASGIGDGKLAASGSACQVAALRFAAIRRNNGELVARVLVVNPVERDALYHVAHGGSASDDDFAVAHRASGARQDDSHLSPRK